MINLIKFELYYEEDDDYPKWKRQETIEIEHQDVLKIMMCLSYGDMKRAMTDFLEGKPVVVIFDNKKHIIIPTSYAYRGYKEIEG